ncbi:MAG: CopD family protein [Hyphomonas sp.]|uniref:CopD family protein n=1 Tax=Hyphomonas sp. TaxID=87 RepID=UPI0034A010E7
MDIYLWVKSAHLIFVVALMAGLLIYPRYKIHQLSSRPGEPLFETMKDASARLKRIILNPSLGLVWVLGIWMLYLNPDLLTQGWMHAKLLLVLGISGLQGYFITLGKRVDAVTGTVQAKTLRMLNEVPFIMMIGVVIMVIVRPF